jgi:hypothetical protein
MEMILFCQRGREKALRGIIPDPLIPI